MILLHVLLLFCGILTVNARFKVLYEWNSIDFIWPMENAKSLSIRTGQYNPEKITVSDLKYHKDYLYLTLPRSVDGGPVTLARMPYHPNASTVEDTSPKLEAYPSWGLNRIRSCDAFQNVQSIEIDGEHLMWILDNGIFDGAEKKYICLPKLIIHDLLNNETITTYTFQENMGKNMFLFDLVVDKTDGDFAYITDSSSEDPGLIVYSRKTNNSWKVRDASMRADPDAIQFTINGTRFDQAINVASIAFNPSQNLIYFAPLSSRRIYIIETKHLKNPPTDVANYISQIGRKSSQSAGITIDEHGILYYGLLSAFSIAKWNTSTVFANDQKVIAKDPTFIQFPSSFAFDSEGNLLVITNRLQKLQNGGSYNIQEGNIRILGAKVNARSYIYAEEIQIEDKTDAPPVPEQEKDGVIEKLNTTEATSFAPTRKLILSLYVISLSLLFL